MKTEKVDLNHIVEALPDAAALINGDGIICLVNELTAALSGYSRKELLGQPLEMLLPDDLRLKHVAHREGFFDNPAARRMGADLELSMKRKDGSQISVDISISPLRIENQMFVLSSIRDMTDHKSLKKKALAVENQFTEFMSIDSADTETFCIKFNSPLDLNWSEEKIVDEFFKQAIFVDGNNLLAKSYGYDKKEDLIGKPVRMFFSPLENKNIEAIKHLIANNFNSIDVISEENDINGIERTVSNSTFSHISDNKLLHVWGICHDVTQRERIAKELQEKKDQLEHLARVSVAGEITASVAHELRQPLTAIRNNAQAAIRFLGKKHYDIQEILDIFHDIVSDNERASDVVLRLREFIKFKKHSRTVVNATDMINDVVKLVHSELLIKDISIKKELNSNAPQVRGDVIGLQEVLMNLIFNGVDSIIQADSKNREITIISKTYGESHIVISVQDTGKGINEEDLEKIFEPFMSTKPDGLGMGLAINRTIIEAHGGRIWAQNNKEDGATVSFSVPIYQGSI